MAKRNILPAHHVHVVFVAAGFALGVLAALVLKPQAEAEKPIDRGFDQFGYNYTADVFTGKADGVDRLLDGKVWGDPTYASDRLVMKWSKAWDDARFGGSPWTCDAWTDNEWNGKTPGGSDETWHYKIVWVGPQKQSSSCWRPGGYSIWGDFEVVFSQGTVANQHFWDAHANPPGYGGF